jgi:hypothetical protein
VNANANKPSCRPPRRFRGFISLEMLVAITLLILLVGLFARVTTQYAALRREIDTRRMLRLAAAAELDRLRAGLETTAPDQPDDAPCPITICTARTPGRDAWAGLTRVCVTASRRLSPQRLVTVEVSAYLDLPEEQP